MIASIQWGRDFESRHPTVLSPGGSDGLLWPLRGKVHQRRFTQALTITFTLGC